MGAKNPDVDAYIERAQPFARPILKKLRVLFHSACPDIEERLKWGVPSFEYEGIVGGMAAFKAYVIWGLWKAALLNDPDVSIRSVRITAVGDLPSDRKMLEWIRKAAELNKLGIKVERPANATKRPLPKTPPDFSAALGKDAKARATFQSLSPSHKREYIEWILEAKQESTRQRRVAQAIEWMAEGKSRNWKYERR